MSILIDPAAQTAQYIDSLGPEALAKAAAYTVGNHWLLLANVIVAGLLALVIVRTGVLDRRAAALAGRGWALRTFAVCAAFFAISSVLALPWDMLTDWSRERSFGLSSQSLGDFLFQWSISTILSALLGGLFFLGLYALIRRTGQRWWLWGGGFSAVVLVLMLLVGPSLIEPLFNSYKPVPPGAVRTALEQIADDVNIPHDRIFMYDGSRQSDRFTANVSGIGPTARIAIADVALANATLAEVRAVTGHEAGHYKLGHVWRSALVMPLLAMLFFFLLNHLFAPAARLFGSTATLGEARGLPVFMAVGAVLSLLVTPLTNTLTRIGEAEADAYSFANVGEPEAMASALVKTAEYRYPRPGALQEFLFYTHPSVEKRVRAAMDWRAAHPDGLAPKP